MRVGLYGGTFSPVHVGHVAAARAFRDQMALDTLHIVPAGRPPHRALPGDASAEDRLTMCRLAFEGMEGVVVDDLEIRRAGVSYTADTLRLLSRPSDRLFLLLGTDSLLALDTWRDPEEIFRLALPVYIRRESDASLDAAIVAKLAAYRERYGRMARRIVAPPIEVSSTRVREAARKGEPIDGLVPEAVARYIREKGLYGGRAP